ncbi:hypothetical protein AX16_002079 [Volvariella volvacea WC 439]|nr:hypothetical protein AX16_002079 [Volvariella volvacea WC 439]
MGVHAFFWFSSKSQVDPAPTGMEADSGPVAQEASPSVHPAPQLSREPSNPEAVEKSHAHRYLPRFSFRGWGWSRHQRASTHDKVTRGSKRPKTLARVLHPGSKKRAKESALLVRSVIVGPPTSASPKVTPVVAKPQLNKIRQQLSQPKTANKVIAQLRSLPSSDPSPGEAGSTPQPAGPIHAVCLSHTDAEEDALHFCHLKETGSTEPSGQNFGVPMTSEPMERLTSMLNELRIIDLISQPDLGLGQPANGKGLFAGALPTPETVIKGFKQVTPQLMALGYATGRSITPNHAGIYPPTDRMSILTCRRSFVIKLSSINA